MSTRCNIHFNQEKEVCANIYRHCDGYPDGEHGVLADLQKFFAEVKKQTIPGLGGPRFDDPYYLAAKFVVWQAGRNARDPSKPLDFLSLGIMKTDACDGQYVYTVDCGRHDGYGFPIVTHKKKPD